VTLERPSLFRPLNFYGGDNEKEGIGWFGPAEENGYWNPKSRAVREGVREEAGAAAGGAVGGGGGRDDSEEILTLPEDEPRR
jgi:hypothetical protein